MSTALILILLTLVLVSLIDYVPRVLNAVKKPVQVTPGRGRTPSFLLMPTVYGDIKYLKNVDFLRKYAKKTVICTSKYETPAFYRALSKVCRENGFRYIEADLPFVNGKPVKNAYTIYKGALQDLQQLGIKPKTTCILIDADTYCLDKLDNAVRAFVHRGLDVASLRCEVPDPQTTLEVLQAYEYRLAMDGRRSAPWLTSGACNMARAGVFQHVFSRHSHFFAGGDIEIGKLAQVMGYQVGHIDFTFFTEVPSTFKDWYHQRIVWFAGGIRHHVVNLASFSWHHYFVFLYNSLIIYLLLPLRWVELCNYPLTFFLLVLISWVYVLVLHAGRGWRKEYLLLPAYAFIQSMIILPIAFVRYAKYAWSQRSFGVLQYDISHVGWGVRAYFKVLNVAAATVVLVAATLFTTARVEYWYAHGHWMRAIVAFLS